MSEAWPTAERPTPESVRERERILAAAAAGDVATVRQEIEHAEDRVRATAARSLAQLGQLDGGTQSELHRDESPRVRRTVAELAAADSSIDLRALLADTDSTVTETACWAAGEHGADGRRYLALLVTISATHEDALCREAAVAALGAIGSIDGLEAILAATHDRATVRRRAVLALAPFASPEVDEALSRALEDRDWQVRQAAEDLVGHPDEDASAGSA